MIEVNKLSKVYKIYEDPTDRLKQSIFRGRKKFYKEFWPIKEMSFTVEQGEIVGIVGANGSGKSTLLQLICGILQPTCGNIYTKGRIAALLELGAGFNPEFTGHDNLFMNAALLGLTKAEIEARYNDIVEFAGIGDFLYQPVKTYSSGMAVRLAFAISSFVDADILVVDEALSVGDAGFQAKCLERMERLMKQGTTVLLVTHDVQLIKRYCNRVLYIKHGKLVYDGSPEEGTEIYLAETKESNSASHQITRSISSSALGFSSQLGSITSASLIVQGAAGKSVVVRQGDRMVLEVHAKISTDLIHPRIQMTVRDGRGYNLFGFNNYYANKKLIADADGNVLVRYAFDVNLQAGDYAITLRLDNVDNVDHVNLVDKQVGVVDFTVVVESKRFDAVIDLNGSCEVIS
ncbi:MAG: ABC transporter ATP-binding protein [Cellvibrio sp.]|uniref:ABC transporter ATP-binding protein n=1 Tax=Cellvibrio sp. TaxID=1965322 RepID=UPI0031AD3817